MDAPIARQDFPADLTPNPTTNVDYREGLNVSWRSQGKRDEPCGDRIIIKYSGTLERYAGDGAMVVFNDPVPVENPALQAVLMALEVRDAIGALTATWSRLGHEIGFGIGIAHGFATLGTIGFEG